MALFNDIFDYHYISWKINIFEKYYYIFLSYVSFQSLRDKNNHTVLYHLCKKQKFFYLNQKKTIVFENIFLGHWGFFFFFLVVINKEYEALCLPWCLCLFLVTETQYQKLDTKKD